MIRRLLLAAALAASARPASAQEFFPRFDFHLDGAYLTSEDDRFSWDADFGADLDVFDWGDGRATFLVNYEVILGNQLRRFDPNQGNYILEGAASTRTRHGEIGLVFHHTSRHLSDRTKRAAIDWNMLGGRLRNTLVLGRMGFDTQLDARATLKKSFVDYQWEVAWNGAGRYAVRPRVAFITGGGIRIVGVDDTRGRAAQTAGRGEAGVSLVGGAGLMEFFLAIERRLDPYPLEFGTETWMLIGFRLKSR